MIWRKVTESLPIPGIPVIAFVVLENGRYLRLRAQYSNGRSLTVADELTGDYGEYDEETGEWWCPEGWYETNDFEEIHWAIDGTVTHWMELPPPPDEFK